jgi:hypothetical protein
VVRKAPEGLRRGSERLRKGSAGPAQRRADLLLQPRGELGPAALGPHDGLETDPKLLAFQTFRAFDQMLFDGLPSLPRHLVVDVPLDEAQDFAAVNL